MNAIDQSVISEAHKFAGETHKLFIGGNWVEAESDSVIETRDPSTDKILGAAPDGTPGDIEDRSVDTWEYEGAWWSSRQSVIPCSP